MGVHQGIKIENVKNFLGGFFLVGEGGVTLLPQELAGT